MTKYGVLINGDLEDDVFDTESEAEDYATYLKSCAKQGAEILHMSNPGDYDEDDYDTDGIEVVEIDDNGEIVEYI